MGEKERVNERMTMLLKRVVERGPAGAACKVVRRGETLYGGGFGLADIETKRAIAPDTLYRIYSMTMLPNKERETHPRLRHVVYGALD